MSSGMRNEARIFPGLYQGTVLEVNEDSASEEELALIQLGWIKVSLFDLSDTFAWARPCFPYGHFFVPKAGDRVWLAFEGGNRENPVWLGIWYPQDTVPLLPDETDPEPVQRLIRSESGHVLLFDDTEDATNITVNSAGGHSLVFDDTEDEENELVPIIVLTHCMKEDNQIVLKEKKLTISADEKYKITLDNDSDNDQQNIAIAADAYQIKLDKTNQNIDIAADSVTINLDNQGTAITLTVNSNTITLDDQKIQLKFGGSTITLDDKKIELKVGCSTITLTADGIKLKSPLIDLN